MVARTAISAAFHNGAAAFILVSQGCSNRHFGGLSQQIFVRSQHVLQVARTAISAAFHNHFAEDSNTSLCCSNRHFGGLSQRRSLSEIGKSELLEPPFRRPFTTVTYCIPLSDIVARTAISAAFHNAVPARASPFPVARTAISAAFHNLIGLDHHVYLVARTAISAAFHNSRSIPRTSRCCCSNRHFGGLSQPRFL